MVAQRPQQLQRPGVALLAMRQVALQELGSLAVEAAPVAVAHCLVYHLLVHRLGELSIAS
eukprot:scaffold191383_cov41-Prasinocladus_malaysianus.AAC.1